MDLDIPASGKTGKSPFKTSTPAVSEWVANLPLINIKDCVEQLEFALDELNKIDVPAAERHAALELLTAPVMHVIGALKKSYLGKRIPLRKQDLDNAAKASGLCNRMAISYKILVTTLGNQPESGSTSSALATAIHHAIRYLSEVLTGNYQIYAPYPDGIWKALHTLYATGEQHALLRHQVDDISPGYPEKSTIEESYKQILLLSLACPYRLRQNEISGVYKLLSQWARYSKLLSKSEGHSGGFFTWDLDSDDAPTYLTIKNQQARATQSRFLNTSDMEEPIRAALKAHQESTQRFSDYMEERILQRLMLTWGLMPKRQFARRRQDAAIQMVSGLKAIHRIITEPTPEGSEEAQEKTGVTRDRESLCDPTLEQPTTINTDAHNGNGNGAGHLPDQWQENPLQGAYSARNPDAGNGDATPLYAENWKMQDMSAGGYCLLWDSAEASSAQIGELVAIKTSHDRDENWHLGVIRWMKFFRERGLGLGVQMMSPGARAVWARLCDGKAGTGDKLQGILLPDVEGLHQQATLLLPSLPFRSGCLSQLTRGDVEKQVRLTTRLEDTGSFAQFYFSPANESCAP